MPSVEILFVIWWFFCAVSEVAVNILCEAVICNQRDPVRRSSWPPARGVLAQESNDAGHVVDARRPVTFLPVDDGQFMAGDYFRYVDLPELEVEPSLASRFADGLGLAG
jgi:hypothetical protein